MRRVLLVTVIACVAVARPVWAQENDIAVGRGAGAPPPVKKAPVRQSRRARGQQHPAPPRPERRQDKKAPQDTGNNQRGNRYTKVNHNRS
jgi:hypothetical protein